MKIVIIGTGYVGLVTGVCFAEVGVETVCIDIDKNKIENLKKGISPIYEPGLDELIAKNLERGRLSFDTDISKVLDGAEMAFIAVGTPPDEDGSADLKYVLEVAHNIGKYMNDYLVIVTKSTVPVGTAPKVKEAIQFELNKRNLKIDFDVASNPEFLKEGDAINDFMKPDRIVIGVESDRAKEIFQRLYKPFTLNGHPIIFMDIPSAEMTKYAANAMLATRISFMNDIANLCEILGADVNMVRLGIGSDPRIGSKFLYPGIGYGGSCFPKDVKALIKAGEDNNYPLRLLQAVENINEDQKSILVDKLLKFYNGDISGKKIALWGLSFKPNTDDMREAPSLVIIDKLLKHNAQVSAYDPASMEETKRRIGNVINYASDMYEAVKDAEALILVTEWSEFRLPDWSLIRDLMRTHLILDGRNIYDASEMKEMGFYYYCIGVKTDR